MLKTSLKYCVVCVILWLKNIDVFNWAPKIFKKKNFKKDLTLPNLGRISTWGIN